MAQQLALSPAIQALLRCPVCRCALSLADGALRCLGTDCRRAFPVVDGVPVLINEAASLFSIDDFVRHRDTTFETTATIPRRLLRALRPSVSLNVNTEQNYRRFSEALHARADHPTVLVVGAGKVGAGMRALLADPTVHFLETDVSFGPRTAIICDGHDLPLADESLDGVVVQAVLEHVVDPYRCVAEMTRVLKANGVVYAETPFMQQVHEGRYDFTRFTHLGHRRLFRHYDEIESGPICGPDMALAWSYLYFLTSFAESRFWRRILTTVASFSAFYLKYFDYFLCRKPGAYDAAAGYYFLGAKSRQVLSDRELIAGYRGTLGR